MGYAYPAQNDIPDYVAHLFRQAHGETCVLCGHAITGQLTVLFGNDLPAHVSGECIDVLFDVEPVTDHPYPDDF
jgi:hypothetical protein